MWVIVDDRTALSLEGAYEVRVRGDGDDLTIEASLPEGRTRILKTGMSRAAAYGFLSDLAAGKPLDFRSPPEPMIAAQ